MGVVTGDPLTTAMFHWSDAECDCPAKELAAAAHWWTCGITPMFASFAASLDLSDILNEFTRVTGAFGMTQTVIKCAECGAERLAKDLVVIYQAPLSNIHGLTGKYKYPKNIVKAVCPKHDTIGRVSYQRPMPSGY